jgi:hypothetical protein
MPRIGQSKNIQRHFVVRAGIVGEVRTHRLIPNETGDRRFALINALRCSFARYTHTREPVDKKASGKYLDGCNQDKFDWTKVSNPRDKESEAHGVNDREY